MRILMLALVACGHEPPPDFCSIDACSPAATCADMACSCPTGFIPAAPTFAQQYVRADLPQLPGLVTSIGLLQDAEVEHAVLVAVDPATVSIDTDIDLAQSTEKVGFGYQVDPTANIRAAFLATRGTLRVSAACATGVSGTVAGVDATEIDLFADLAPVPGGCGLTVPTVTFAIGTCP